MVVVEKKTVHHPNTQAQLHALIDGYKAGSPTKPNMYWIHLKPKEIATLYFDQYGVLLSNGFIKRELLALGYRYRIEETVKLSPMASLIYKKT